MRPLSATECISPAIARTTLVLFSPFRKGRSWKLSATAAVCRYGTVFLPFPLIYLFSLPVAHKAAGILGIAILCGVVAIVMAIYLFVFYLCSRLQFAWFDIVVNRGEFVAPAWRKYRRQSLSWTGLKILLGAGFALACALPIAEYIRHLIPLFHDMPNLTPGQPPPPQMMAAIAAGYAIYFAFFLILGCFYLVLSLLTDFLLPSLALEDTGLSEAFRRMTALMRREPGEFAIYTILKIVLGFAGYMGGVILWELIVFIVSLVVALIAFVIGLGLHAAGVPSGVLGGLGILLAVAWYLFITIYTLPFVIGPVMTYLDAYALYFLGGRYPLLGDLLDRSTPPPSATPYPAPYSYPPPPQ